MATFVGSDAYTGDKALSYPLIASAIIAGLYIRWLKQEMLKKHTNTDWKETKPQDTSEKTEFIPPSRIYETEKIESIPSSYIYEIISGEMERKEYKKGLATRAFAEANGDKELAKSLYIKFRYAELFSEMELERKEKQRQQQMEDECIERERAETQQEQSIWTKDWTGFGIFTNDWVIVTGICFVAFFIWFGSKTESTPTTNTPPTTVASVPAQSVPQATSPDNYDFLKTYKPPPDTQVTPQAVTENKPAPVATDKVDYSSVEHLLGDDYGKSKQQNQSESTSQDILQRANNLYEQGRYTEALPLYQNLAEQGNVDAQMSLGAMYHNGLGVAKDEQKAGEWYLKAAEQGSKIARFIYNEEYRNR
jgi:hypothetical protein